MSTLEDKMQSGGIKIIKPKPKPKPKKKEK